MSDCDQEGQDITKQKLSAHHRCAFPVKQTLRTHPLDWQFSVTIFSESQNFIFKNPFIIWHISPVIFTLGQVSRETKVCYLDNAIGADEDVPGGEVPVDAAVGVEPLHAPGHLPAPVEHVPEADRHHRSGHLPTDHWTLPPIRGPRSQMITEVAVLRILHDHLIFSVKIYFLNVFSSPEAAGPPA